MTVADEILCPLLCAALGFGRVGEIAVEEEIAQVEVGAGVFEKAVFLGDDRKSNAGDSGNPHGPVSVSDAHDVLPVVIGVRQGAAMVHGRAGAMKVGEGGLWAMIEHTLTEAFGA